MVTVRHGLKYSSNYTNSLHSHLLGLCALFETLSPYYIRLKGIYSHGIRSAFWNLARQDLICAYFTRSATQLNPDNLPLWCSAGLAVDENKRLQISSLRERGLTEEDQAANGILWLVSKIVNFLSRAKQAQLAQLIGLSTLDLPSNEHSIDPTVWLQLCFDLQMWFDILPETFRPSARIDRPTGLIGPIESKLTLFPEIFYGLPACATAMQYYHFGRIALLLNQPTDAISGLSISFDRLHGYREVTKVDHHSREICGIALGCPHSAVRVFMVPLLYAVGNCLEDTVERQIILDLLRGVKSDLGWVTDYAIERLQQSWNN